MTKKIILVSAVLLLPAVASAAGNVGGCGWGSKLMAGNRGIAPQVLAVTTNGTSGNQTFGISSGTSGCTQNGVVSSNWKTASFIDANMNKLARDMSIGHGETLDSLATLLGVEQGEREVFASVLRSEFSQIFISDDVSSTEVASRLQAVLAADSTLKQYASRV